MNRRVAATLAAPSRPPLVELMPRLGLDGPSWSAWRVVAKCLDGLPLDRDEHELYERCTGRTRPPTEPPAEFFAIMGRRSGKSRFAAAVAVRGAAFTNFENRLAPGERAIVGLAAADREQARGLLNYATAPFQADAILRPLVQPRGAWAALRELVTRETRWGVDLTTGASIEVRTAAYGSIRGRSYALVVADELAFWQSEDGSNPASEVLNAVRPGLVTLGGQLLGISSPYARRGPLWDVYTRYWGKEDDRVLVWRALTRVMNPTIPERVVLDALERDEASARAEWLAEFRDDVSGLLTTDLLARVVVPKRVALDPKDCDFITFVDPSSGAGQDSMTLAVAHGEQEPDGRVVAVLDRVEEVRPPFDPHAVAREFAALARSYGCDRVIGDGFAKGWLGAAFEQAGVRYEPSEWTRSELYVRLLVGITGRRVELLDHPRLLAQLTALERRPGAGGRETVDHPSTVGAHDDVANAAAGALAFVLAEADRPALIFR